MSGPAEIVKLYARLLAAADEVLRRPFDPARRERLYALTVDVTLAVEGPAERRLMFDHERMLAQCLLLCERGRGGFELEHAMAFAQVAGVLLPWVQEHSAAAMNAARAPVPTSDGAGGGRSR